MHHDVVEFNNNFKEFIVAVMEGPEKLKEAGDSMKGI